MLKLPFSAKPLIQRLAKAYGLSLAGLFFLGFSFALIKAPCATPLLLVLLSKIVLSGSIGDIYLLTLFGLGVLLPLIGIGIAGGSSPHLAKRIREKYRRLFRSITGLMLIALGLWFLL